MEPSVPPADLNFKDWAAAVESIATAVAIVAGGLWAYFKFVRGRTFAKRVELNVTPTLLLGEPRALQIRASLKNVGLSKLPLALKVILFYGLYPAPTATNPAATEVRKLGKAKRIFEGHRWIESQETVTDEILLLPDLVGGQDALGFRVECTVFAKRTARKKLKWTASAIVPVEPTKVQGSTGGIGDKEEVNL